MLVRPGRLMARGSGGSFNPLSLAPYAFYLPEPQYLFQDAAMTTPVTAADDPVGAMLDLSGNDRHVTQATLVQQPLYKTAGGLHWLEFDGTDDTLTVSFSVAQPIDRISALRRITDFADNQILGGLGANTGVLYIISNQLRIFSGLEVTGLAEPAAGDDFVATERHNGASSRLAIDNDAYQTGDAGANAANGLAIASREGTQSYANIRLYGLAQFDRALTDGEIAKLRTYMAARQGRVL